MEQPQHQQGEEHKKELDRNESVRARLLAISQVSNISTIATKYLSALQQSATNQSWLPN